MPETTRSSLHYPSGTDLDDPRSDLQTLAEDIETAHYAIDASGLAADLPAAGVVGRYYFTLDGGVLYRDNGTDWDITVPATGTITDAMVAAGAALDPAKIAAPDRIKVFRNTSHQAIASGGAWTRIAWNAYAANAADTTESTMWSSGTNPTRIQPVTPGLYGVVCQVDFFSNGANDALGSRMIRIEKNSAGTEDNTKQIGVYAGSPVKTASNGSVFTVPAVFPANGTSDHIEVWVWQDSGVSQDLYYGAGNTFINVYRISTY